MNDSEDLLTIGQVSVLCGISIKTLRYYDKIGLLKPAYVDPQSKYRYYSKTQMVLITFFKGMKSLGFSSDELRSCFKDNNFSSEVLVILDKKMSQVTKQLEELHQVKQRLAIAMQALKEKEARQPGEINIKDLPSRRVIFIKSRLKHDFHAVTAKMMELGNLARENNFCFKGGLMTVFHDNYRVFDGNEGVIEVCGGVFSDKSYDYPFIREIPSGLYASVIHEGNNHVLFNGTYPRLYEWIIQNNYEPIGPAINAYLDVPDGRVAKKVTIEIQVPIKKSS